MSKTHRKHESRGRQSRRGPKNRADDPLPKDVRKSASQRRRGDKQNLRKEWL